VNGARTQGPSAKRRPAPEQHVAGNAVVARAILSRLRADGYCGHDPYDALHGPLSACLSGVPMAQRLLTQVVKRTPFHVQPLLGIPRSVSATTLGYSLVALARLHRRGCIANAESSASMLRAGLLKMAVLDSSAELAWGSHTDVTTRFGNTPKTMPNVVVTSCAAQGLIEATAAELVDARADLARVAGFCRHALTRRDQEGRLWFAYTPDSSTMIHNGSALAIRILDACAWLLEDEFADAASSEAIETLVAYQQRDGSWPYAECDDGRWVDGFHTGFILETLGRRLVRQPTDRCDEALWRGASFYLRELFGPDGAPRYSTRSAFPYDAMSAAQALEVLPLLSERVDGAGRLLGRVVVWVRERLLLGDERVAYQVHRFWTDRRQFPRWSLAPMAAALAGLAGEEPASIRQ
jgi:hypothetical protein